MLDTIQCALVNGTNESDELRAAQARIEALLLSNEKLVAENRQLQHRIDWLVRQMFGRKSEKIDPNQMTLGLPPLVGARPEPDPEPPSPVAPPRSRSRRKGHGRRTIPENVPVRRKDLGPKACERLCPCHGRPMRCARVEVTRKLDYQRAEIFCVETHSEIAVCAEGGDAIEQTAPPPSVIDKGLAAPGLLSFVVISKYLDHLPLYRLERMFARWGIPLPRSTLVGWIRQVAEAVRPVYDEIGRQIRGETFLQSDDTPVRVLDGPTGPFTGRFWSWRDVKRGRIYFEFRESRAGAHPKRFLGDWQGRLQADAYSGYDALYETGRVVEFGCWSHARRKVYDALDSDRTRAETLLAPIVHLFLIERDLAGRSADERLARRRELSRPVLDQIEGICAELAVSALPRSPLGVAVGYIQSNWKALSRFVEDGEAELHNNAIENAIRPVALGRKNWLFAGSPEGGERSAILYTLVENCRVEGIDPEAYFRDVLEGIPTHPNRRIGELTPAGWNAARDQAAAETSAAKGRAA